MQDTIDAGPSTEPIPAAAEVAAALVMAAFKGDYPGAVDAVAAPGVDARLVAVELAAIAADALHQAYGDQTYNVVARQLARARRAGAETITWHRGTGSERGFWTAEAGNWTIATAWVHDLWAIGEPGRYSGEIYGEATEATTLREFKALVAKAHAERVQA
jgi:hypothetical protein